MVTIDMKVHEYHRYHLVKQKFTVEIIYFVHPDNEGCQNEYNPIDLDLYKLRIFLLETV
jgi:hypothetical protein